MIAVHVESNWREVYKALDSVARKQVPFAAALTLTRLARAGQVANRARLPGIFQLRSGWVSRGITFRAAQKRDWPHQRAVVGSRDDFMVDHEEGATRRPRRAADLAIPGKDVAAQLRGATGRIPKSRRPTRLKKRKGYFVQRLVKGQRAGQFAVLQRATDERYPLRVIYVFQKSAKIRKVLGFRDTVIERANRLYAPLFARTLAQAIASVKVSKRVSR